MSRLTHSYGAMLRALQMSRHDIFVFVEGWHDRYFYDRVCRVGTEGSGLTFDVRTSRELGASVEGKEGLLRFFSYLRGRGKLCHTFKGKKLALLFFVDKDIDDYLRRLKRSAHVVYTEYYAVENHLLRHVDLVRVAAAVSCLDSGAVGASVGDQGAWLAGAAREWKEWTKLCFLSRVAGANCVHSYKVASRVNNGAYGGLLAGGVEGARAEIRVRSGLRPADFESALKRAEKSVEEAFRTGQQDRVFKGKWYAAFIAEVARRAAAGRQYDDKRVGERALEMAALVVDLGAPWATHFVGPVREVVALLVRGVGGG